MSFVEVICRPWVLFVFDRLISFNHLGKFSFFRSGNDNNEGKRESEGRSNDVGGWGEGGQEREKK